MHNMNDNKYLTIGALTRYLKAKFDQDPHLKTVFLKGEISNFKAHSTGHMYFSLKDETSKINAIVFSSRAKLLNFKPEEGSKVLVTGRVSVYEATGNYQIYVDDMMLDGVGNLYIAFEELKKQLASEGLFDPKYKKPIPKIPERIGIITASTGAAVKDIISTIRRRFPMAETLLFPCLVQGEFAKDDIVKKIKQANTYDLDVLIVGRGGGAIEDLWPFNEEIVARAIFASNIPVISAVGHEVDFTIADFVADLRAPTPTGAAEMAVPNIADLQNYIKNLNIRLNESMSNRLKNVTNTLEHLKNNYILKNPTMIFDPKKQKLMLIEERLKENIKRKMDFERIHLNHLKDSYVLKNPKLILEQPKQQLKLLQHNLNGCMEQILTVKKHHLERFRKHYILMNPKLLYEKQKLTLAHNVEKLEVVNPLHILSKGYNLAYEDNKLIKSVTDINKNSLKLRFYDGTVYTKIDKIEKDN